LIEALTPPGQPKPSAEQIKAINLLLTAGNDVQALAAVARGLKDLAVADDKLKANRVPVLAVVGADDPLKAGVDLLKDRMANLQVVVIKDADHMTAFTKPEFIKSLEDFLAKHRTQEKPKERQTVPAK
jgi:pimeloyl-ACP methyl ester carboxylesterase